MAWYPDTISKYYKKNSIPDRTMRLHHAVKLLLAVIFFVTLDYREVHRFLHASQCPFISVATETLILQPRASAVSRHFWNWWSNFGSLSPSIRFIPANASKYKHAWIYILYPNMGPYTKCQMALAMMHGIHSSQRNEKKRRRGENMKWGKKIKIWVKRKTNGISNAWLWNLKKIIAEKW